MTLAFLLCYNHLVLWFWRNTQVWLKGSVLKTDRSLTRRRGSNPFSSAIVILLSRDGSSLVARRAHNPEVEGSNPSPATIWFVSLEAYDACLSRRRPRVRIPYEPPSYGSIAQSVEQRTENPCVTGSIPVGATICFVKTLVKQSKKLLILREK